MDITQSRMLYFSPTGTTKKVLAALAEGLGLSALPAWDLTPRGLAAVKEPKRLDGELALIGVPVYAGRVPLDALKALADIQAADTPAVLVVVYGNRAMDDALLELSEVCREMGLRPLAAAAFIGEHSFSNEDTPIAVGRPDAADLNTAREFGRRIRARLDGAQAPAAPEVPGKHPYRERLTMPPMSPVTDPEICILCGACAEACPKEIITVDDQVVTRAADCILCCACVKACPTGARSMQEPAILKIAQMLTKEHAAPKQPQLFL